MMVLAASGIWASGITACSSFGSATDDTDATATDAGVAADARRTCDPRGEFSGPTLVPAINDGLSTYGARLTADELTIYFSSERTGGLGRVDIWTAKRPSTGVAFGTPTIVGGDVSTALGGEDYPTVSAAGDELFFSRIATDDVDTYDVFRATLVDGGFSAVAPFIQSPRADFAPFVAKNGDVYFQSFVTPSRSFQIRRKPRTGPTSFAPDDEEISEPNTTEYAEGAPVLSDDMLTIYFTSTRPGAGASKDGKGDVWVARRTSVREPFGESEQVLALTAAGVDAPTWLSPDNCRLYISSQRDGKLQTYVASRTP